MQEIVWLCGDVLFNKSSNNIDIADYKLKQQTSC